MALLEYTTNQEGANTRSTARNQRKRDVEYMRAMNGRDVQPYSVGGVKDNKKLSFSDDLRYTYLQRLIYISGSVRPSSATGRVNE
jgi:hypothetical protein